MPSARVVASCREYLVIEDHKSFGQRFARLLRKWGKPTVVMTLCDAIAAIRSQRWTALFVDPGLPDGSGLDAIVTFRDLQPFGPVLVVTGGASEVERERAWSLGARYVEKPDMTEALVEDFLRSGAVLEARISQPVRTWRDEELHRTTKAKIAEPTKLQSLTLEFDTVEAAADLLSDRERDIVHRRSLGHTTKVIAYDLGLSPSTVRVHLARATAKTSAGPRKELVGEAASLGPMPVESLGRRLGGNRRH
jgi:DNA-binding NarL/FixJ family response regulator